MPTQQTHARLELVSEVADLAAGVGIISFTVFPFALPALALTALAALLLLVPVLVGAVLAAPILVVRRLRQARDRPLCVVRPAAPGGDTAATRRLAERGARSGILARPDAVHADHMSGHERDGLAGRLQPRSALARDRREA